jgi:regulatory protein
MSDYFSAQEAKNKLEHYCSYQERCHDEVLQKLRSMALDKGVADTIILSLLADNYLNETRFACSFARGKHRIKHWGKIRIVNELKARHISKYNIDTALKEINPEDYLATFHSLAEMHWENMRESNLLKKRKKFCDFLLRKGFESNLVYDKVKELEGMAHG